MAVWNYSAPAVVTPFPIGLSRDRAKWSSCGFEERIERRGRTRRGIEKGREWNLLETNTHEHCSCLGGTSSIRGETRVKDVQVKHTHTFSLRVINEINHVLHIKAAREILFVCNRNIYILQKVPFYLTGVYVSPSCFYFILFYFPFFYKVLIHYFTVVCIYT